MKVTFGVFTLDGGARTLFRVTQPVHLSPKAFDLLKLLVDRAPNAVSKHDIHALLWPGTFVSDVNLAVLIAEIRGALGETARRPKFIRTVQRFGYAFSATPTLHRTARTCSNWWIEWERGAKRAALVLGDNVVGRDPACDLQIEGVGVSRRHAIICVSADAVMLRDLGSKNGTYVNGMRVTGETRLDDGSEIGFAAAVATFRYRATPKSTETVSKFSPA